jgi:diguanylate cyclase (GGDEF)-like protein
LLVSAVAYLDGGTGSPAIMFLVLVMIYTALAYPTKTVIAFSLLELVCFCLIAWFGEVNPGLAHSLYAGGLLVLSNALAATTAHSRTMEYLARESLSNRLMQLARTDSLTGCFNYRAFRQHLDQEMARSWRHEHTLALFIIDVDWFKSINDEHGHLVGDDILRNVGRSMEEVARRSDVPGRSGGDEFVLLAPETNAEQAHVLAQRLRSRVAETTAPIKVTLSIGICATCPTRLDSEEVLRAADQALYEVKRAGRNGISVRDLQETAPETAQRA